jgi:hypothetical protein
MPLILIAREAKLHRLIESTMQALSHLGANAQPWQLADYQWVWEAPIAAVEITGALQSRPQCSQSLRQPDAARRGVDRTFASFARFCRTISSEVAGGLVNRWSRPKRNLPFLRR